MTDTDRGGLGARGRARGPHRAGHRDQDLLLLPEPLRRRAQHQRVPGVPRPAGQPAGAEPPGGRAGHPARRGGALRRAAVDLPPEELLLSRHAEGLPDQPVRPADQRRRLPRAPVGHRVGITRAHLEEDTGKSTHIGGDAAVASTAASTASSTTTAPACRCSRSCPSPTSARSTRPVTTSASCAPSSSPPVCPTPRWKRARCASTPTCRCAAPATTAFGTRCEIKNLNSVRSLGRAIEYEAAPPDRPPRSGRARPAGDPPLGRGRRSHPHAAR